ncbi:unnamed protein product [Ixodes hexagonus]
MADFVFVLPLAKDDLRRAESIEQYVVKDVLTAREITTKAREHLSKKKSPGECDILDSFDLLYSSVVQFHSLEEKTVQGVWDLALRCSSKVESELTLLLDDSDAPLSSDTRKLARNRLKMTCYALCQLADLIEKEVCKPNLDTTLVTAKGRKKPVPKSAKFVEWSSEKMKALTCLQNMFELHLQRLWSPQPVEEEFINLVADCCFKLVEDPSSAKTAGVKEAVMSVLGLNIKKHSYGLACVVKILQALQTCEHAAVFFADAMLTFVKKFGVTHIVGDTIREVCRLDSLESAQDSGSIRNVATFLVELAERMPELVLKSASLLDSLLDIKSNTIRSSVLTVFSKAVLAVLSRDNLDPGEKELRDLLLDKLEAHLEDENAFVRSKVLQLWQELCGRGVIPLGRQHALVDMVAGRLLDKSSLVRKQAVSFLAINLDNNPFSAKLSLEKLEKNLAAEKEKLKQMMSENEANEGAEGLGQADSSWLLMLPDIQEALKEHCNGHDASQEIKQDEVEEDEGVLLSEVLQDIRTLLKKGCYSEAVAVVKKAITMYPESNLFCASESSPETLDGQTDEEKENGEDEKPCLVDVLRKIYQGGSRPDDVRPEVPYQDENPIPEIGGGDAVAQPNGTVLDDLSKQKILVRYLEDCVHFAKQMKTIVPTLCDLLRSHTISDVQETIAFFVSAHRFGVEEASVGVREMLPLVWSAEAGVREAVVNSYREVYFGSKSSGNPRQVLATTSKVSDIADSLSLLVSTASEAELLSLEKLVVELVKTGELSPAVLRVLWERYTLQSKDTTQSQSLAAAQLLAMAASADIGIVKKNLDVLTSIGFGERAKADLDLCKHTCCILTQLANDIKSAKDPPPRIEPSNDIFVKLKEVLLETFLDASTELWTPAMEKGVDLVYKLCSRPDQFANDLLQGIATKLLSAAPDGDAPSTGKERQTFGRQKVEWIQDIGEGSPAGQSALLTSSALIRHKNISSVTKESCCNSPTTLARSSARKEQTKPSFERLSHVIAATENGEASSEATAEGEKAPLRCQDIVLCRLLACVGHIGQRQLIYLDVDVYTEMKRLREVAKEEKEKSDKKKKRKSFSATGAGIALSQQESDNADNEISGPASDDSDAERIIHILDHVVLHGDSILGVMSKIVVQVASKPSLYGTWPVRLNASLALASLMLINEGFCDEHLPLLFTILGKSSEPLIRSNLVFPMGDLIVRFPNLLYDWTGKMYAQLQDPSQEVRLCTLRVLSFLILNDLVKVKGQISELAVLVIDADPQVAQMSRNFFAELGKKGNALYNILPDIISHLSNPNGGIDEESFHSVMRVLFGCIDKERQLEGFVDKLCLRFLAVDLERQWCDVAFCLSLMPYSERSIRKLHEQLACYRDKLHLDTVYNSFVSIISGAKKLPTLKAEVKTLLQELEDLIENLHDKGVDEEELVKRTQKGPGQAGRPRRRAKSSCATPQGKKPPPKSAKTSIRPRRNTRMAKWSEDSDAEEGEKKAFEPPSSSRKAMPRRKCKIQLQLSDSDSEGEKAA